MEVFVALLRGINVGGKNILKMKELASLLEDNACRDVKTYIQSGNVVFEREEAPENLDEIIEQEFGFRPSVFVVTSETFLQAVEANPYSADKGNQLHLYFCLSEPTPDVERLESLRIESERFTILNNVLYLHAPDGIGRSKLAAKIESCMGVPTTARNLNTINKLVKMIEEP